MFHQDLQLILGQLGDPVGFLQQHDLPPGGLDRLPVHFSHRGIDLFRSGRDSAQICNKDRVNILLDLLQHGLPVGSIILPLCSLELFLLLRLFRAALGLQGQRTGNVRLLIGAGTFLLSSKDLHRQKSYK